MTFWSILIYSQYHPIIAINIRPTHKLVLTIGQVGVDIRDACSSSDEEVEETKNEINGGPSNWSVDEDIKGG